MAKIKEVREIPLDSLDVGKAQVRTRKVGSGIEELAASIKAVGLLEPIVVVQSDQDAERYEILTGQRRFLAHQHLKRETILAAVLDGKVDEAEAKVISLTENLVREDLSLQDKIDACTFLYKKYGSVEAVAEESGLKLSDVREYVKFDRLVKPLQTMVEKGEVDIKAALRAQDAASVTGETNEDEAVVLAGEMARMSGAQAKKLQKDREKDPDSPVEDVIEESRSGGKITQVVVTLSANVHASLQKYAEEQGQNQDDAAGGLLENALMSEGYLNE